ncbi:hypothetical protein HOC37_05060 [bacterium]|jgi:hypothetical protein|nr:hypothetical protein [bacterium]
MPKIETVIELIKNNKIFSDEEKSFWLEIIPNLNEIEQEEFYKILLEGSNKYSNFKNSQSIN